MDELKAFFSNEVKQTIDMLYILSVIFGAYAFFKMTKQVEWIQNHKAWITFFIGLVFSATYIGLDIYAGLLTDPKHGLFKNFVNFCMATTFYELGARIIDLVTSKGEKTITELEKKD